jgi:hypothetical protein
MPSSTITDRIEGIRDVKSTETSVITPDGDAELAVSCFNLERTADRFEASGRSSFASNLSLLDLAALGFISRNLMERKNWRSAYR